MAKHEDTLSPTEDDKTEPNPVVRRDLTIPVEQLDVETDVDVLKGSAFPLITPHGVTPITPRVSSIGDAAIALAKPKNSPSFVDRKYRLPTESEIKAAVEGTPTDQVPVVELD